MECCVLLQPAHPLNFEGGLFATHNTPQHIPLCCAGPCCACYCCCCAQAVVKSIDLKHKQLSLSIRPDRISQGVTDPAAAAAKAATTAAAAEQQLEAAAADGAAAAGGGSKRRLPPAGQLVTGKVLKILGAGVVIELTKTLKGIVALTDLHDGWVPNALAGVNPGQFVRARVLGADSSSSCGDGGDGSGSNDKQQQQPLVDKHGHLLLSLKPSDGGAVAGVEGWGEGDAAADSQQQQKGKKKAKQQQQQQPSSSGTCLDTESLKPGSKVSRAACGVVLGVLLWVLWEGEWGRENVGAKGGGRREG